MIQTPKISFLVPTRDRPEFVACCLEALAAQTYENIEVIVSDNAANRPCKEVFDRFADSRFHYIRPEESIGMDSNWEFALDHATGDYVSVIIDKTFPRPSAAAQVAKLAEEMPAEIYTWWAEPFLPKDDTLQETLEGEYSPQYLDQSCNPFPFDPQEELRRRYSFVDNVREEDTVYFRGKIAFGVYSSELIRRIREKQGRLFYPLSPDYTSAISALAFAKSAVDMGEPLLLQVITSLSNGASCETDQKSMQEFFRITGVSPNLLEELPFPGIIPSTHNGIAYDFVHMRDKIADVVDVDLDFEQLALRVESDLRHTGHDSREEFHQSIEKVLAEKQLNRASTPSVSPVPEGGLPACLRKLGCSLGLMAVRAGEMICRMQTSYRKRVHRELARQRFIQEQSDFRHYVSPGVAMESADSIIGSYRSSFEGRSAFKLDHLRRRFSGD